MSNDILSGGRIDESTDGPNPSSVDDRSRDILGEQKAKEQQDAVGGTQYAPRAEPPPPIPVAQEVAPPLPVVPSFDFNVSGSVLEEVREISRQAIVDAFKNVTINGQGPSIDGSSISFNIPQERPANEVFVFQGVAITQGSQSPNITDIRISSPTEGASARLPEPSTTPRPPDEPRNELIGDKQDRENNERAARDRKIRSDLGLGETSPLDERPEAAPNKGVPIGEKQDAENIERNQRSRQIRSDLGLGEISPLDEESDSAKAYKAAEAKSKEKRESDPDFDRTSDIRQQGETMSEYKERQEKLEQKKTEDADAIEGEAGITRESSGPIAVQLNRADGQGKVFAFLRSDFSTLDGPTLPTSEYYVGGGGGGSSPPHPWKITIEDQRPEGGNSPVWKYKIESASRLFNGFGGTQVTVSGADGVFRNLEEGFYFIEVDFSDGVIDQAQIQIDEDIGNLVETSGNPIKQTKLRQQIGYVYFDEGDPKVRQTAWHNYSLLDACRNGVSVKITIAT
jgi:hypothetical protein